MGEYLMTILWAIIFVIALGVEAATAELVAIWFLPGTVVSLILSLVGVEEWVQGVVFAVISVVLFVLAFTVIRKRVLKKCDAKTDTDLLIGQRARVEESISNLEMRGAVKIDGKIWSARMVDDSETAEVGEYVIVESISGVKLNCKKI
jgi:membrane protein implicated in regulation of membrane protease activity